MSRSKVVMISVFDSVASDPTLTKEQSERIQQLLMELKGVASL